MESQNNQYNRKNLCGSQSLSTEPRGVPDNRLRSEHRQDRAQTDMNRSPSWSWPPFPRDAVGPKTVRLRCLPAFFSLSDQRHFHHPFPNLRHHCHCQASWEVRPGARQRPESQEMDLDFRMQQPEGHHGLWCVLGDCRSLWLWEMRTQPSLASAEGPRTVFTGTVFRQSSMVHDYICWGRAWWEARDFAPKPSTRRQVPVSNLRAHTFCMEETYVNPTGWTSVLASVIHG